jgi:hypothetical protein
LGRALPGAVPLVEVFEVLLGLAQFSLHRRYPIFHESAALAGLGLAGFGVELVQAIEHLVGHRRGELRIRSLHGQLHDPGLAVHLGRDEVVPAAPADGRWFGIGS